EVRQGGSWYEEDYDFFSLPLFVRENTLLAIGADETTADYDFEKDVQIQVYELADGKEAVCQVPTRKGETAVTVKAFRDGEKIILESSVENQGMTYLLRNIHEVRETTGGSIKKDTEYGLVIAPDGLKTEIIL
ncbi:MAG: alpha-xylosidase, partial [Blautia sp.]|nr:alpha-xylosidase [Blautia sp.]